MNARLGSIARTWAVIAAMAALSACSGGTDGTKSGGSSGAGGAGTAIVTSLALLAGSADGVGSADGTGTEATFNHPAGIAVDGNGTVYVADAGNDTIRRITSAGVVTTIAGNPTTSGSADGSGAAARFNLTLSVSGFVAPAGGLAADASGNLVVADAGNHTIRRITSAGAVTTLAGLAGSVGSTDGVGTAARFASPMGVAIAGDGTVYVADTGNHVIRRIATDGTVTTHAGRAGVHGTANGSSTAARFFLPSGVAVDGTGNVYVSDSGNHTVRRIATDGTVTTVAGQAGTAGSADGTGTAATFRNPGGLAIDGAGNLFVADSSHTVRRIDTAGVVTTIAGSAADGAGSLDAVGPAARFNGPFAAAVDPSGNVFVADQDNHVVRKIGAGNTVSTLAGRAGRTGSADGLSTAATMTGVQAVATDSAGNAYLADAGNNTIRKVSSLGVVTTLAGDATAPTGSTDGVGSAARFNLPTGVAADDAGTVYVADTGNHVIRKIAGGIVTTLAGTAGSAGSDNGTGAAARFNLPMGLVVDSSGTVFVADAGNHTIRRVAADGTVTTVAGLAGTAGSTDGSASVATFDTPVGVALGTRGTLYVADFRNRTVRRIASTGTVTTLAGSAGIAGSTDGVGAAARFVVPWGIAADAAGNVYVADPYNNAVRRISVSGAVSTLVGRTGTGRFAEGALPGLLTFPTGVAVGGSHLFIALPTGLAVVRNLIN